MKGTNRDVVALGDVGVKREALVQINHDRGESEVGETTHSDSITWHIVHDNHALCTGVFEVRSFNIKVARVTIGS